MTNYALVTVDDARAVDPDLIPLATSCADLPGVDEVHIVSWDDPWVDWGRFDHVVIRSTWDYTSRLDRFLDWLDTVDEATTIHNPAAIVRWNSDKSYLGDLADHGVAVTPTIFVRPGESSPSVDGVHVVKPSVGAGSNGAARCEADEVADHVAALHSTGRTAMVQPYLDRLDVDGETSLCFVPGKDGVELELSHAFRKAAILAGGEVDRVGGLFAREEIAPQSARRGEIELARAALAVPPVADRGALTFARVDVAPGPTGPVIMELELIEPSFYFETAPGSADLFARRLVGLTVGLTDRR